MPGHLIADPHDERNALRRRRRVLHNAAPGIRAAGPLTQFPYCCCGRHHGCLQCWTRCALGQRYALSETQLCADSLLAETVTNRPTMIPAAAEMTKIDPRC